METEWLATMPGFTEQEFKPEDFVRRWYCIYTTQYLDRDEQVPRSHCSWDKKVHNSLATARAAAQWVLKKQIEDNPVVFIFQLVVPDGWFPERRKQDRHSSGWGVAGETRPIVFCEMVALSREAVIARTERSILGKGQR